MIFNHARAIFSLPPAGTLIREESMPFSRPFFLIFLAGALVFPAPGFSADEHPEVLRAVFCSAVSDREPVDQLNSITPAQGTVYFFTEVADVPGDTLTHRWLHDGWTIAEVPLTVGASRWRTWSSKQIWHLGSGRLTVQVVNGDGEVLLESSIPVSADTESQGRIESGANR